MPMFDKNKSDGPKVSASSNNEIPMLEEMFAAAKDEIWDAAPGFEGRLMARIRGELNQAAAEQSRLIWRVLPAAAAMALLAVAAYFLTGSLENWDGYIFNSVSDPITVENLIALGLF